MPRDHRAARRAVINERAGAGGLPAQHDLLARIDQRQRAAAEPAGRGMEVDIVRHRVGGGIDQRHFDVIALVHHHQRTRHRAVERHGVKRGALIVDDDLLLFDHEFELHDLGTLFGGLFVRVHKRRRHQIDVLTRQVEIVGKRGGRQQEGCGGGAEHGGSAGEHRIVPLSGCLDRLPTFSPRARPDCLCCNNLPVLCGTSVTLRRSSHLRRQPSLRRPNRYDRGNGATALSISAILRKAAVQAARPRAV